MAKQLDPRNLLLTERGKLWLEQFEPEDKETAERLVSHLTLVSHSEFKRSIQKLIETETGNNEDVVAFYAVRELEGKTDFFTEVCDKDGQVQALSQGNDHGSEASIAHLIRTFCKTEPRLLNHPNLDEMRQKKCRTIILVDDFIGSGNRVCDFLDAFWRHPSIKSWHSLKYIKFIVVAYSGMEAGIRRVETHNINASVILERECPSFKDLPWRPKYKTEAVELCREYGKKTCKKDFPLGYKNTMGSMVFEHGCPNNVPPMFWADNKKWHALFPHRSVLSNEKSVFPQEITRQDSKLTLLNAGQKKIAVSGSLSRRGEAGETVLLILALIAQGQRKQSTLSYATGLNKKDCARIIDRCVKWGFISQTKRLTPKGSAELQTAKRFEKISKFKLPERGEDYYYPKLLRSTKYG